jgi:hypothetical protein
LRRPTLRGSWRIVAFALVVVGSLGGAGIYVAVAVGHRDHPAIPPGVRVVTTGASLRGAPKKPKPRRALQLVSLSRAGAPQLLFRSDIPGSSGGNVAVAALASPDTTRTIADLQCDRVYYAGGRGLCLATHGVWPFNISYEAEIFDADFNVVAHISLPGTPSRARVSPDGKVGATTVFVNGDSYVTGTFSTRTNIIDMRAGTIVANLEQFSVTKNGKPFSNKNFNYWGVTFTHDDDHFYATLGSGRHTYLVKGSVRARHVTTMRQNVECPSLSPDEKRIVYKQSVGNGEWRLHVLDLRTMRDKPLAETRSVDDQVEWLDDDHVLYSEGPNILVVPADGTGQPAMFVTDASSPVVVETP